MWTVLHSRWFGSKKSWFRLFQEYSEKANEPMSHLPRKSAKVDANDWMEINEKKARDVIMHQINEMF
jgi:hypothetical protein